jgi:hypothetical protein
MFPFWIIVGTIVILMGIFNKQMLRLLHLQLMSEVFTTPNLKHSSRLIEQLARWLVINLGISFLVQGLGTVLPNHVGYIISSVTVGLSGLLLLAMFGIAIANWKAK